MSKKTDWWPTTKDGQLAMAQNWKLALENNGELWGVKA